MEEITELDEITKIDKYLIYYAEEAINGDNAITINKTNDITQIKKYDYYTEVDSLQSANKLIMVIRKCLCKSIINKDNLCTCGHLMGYV